MASKSAKKPKTVVGLFGRPAAVGGNGVNGVGGMGGVPGKPTDMEETRRKNRERVRRFRERKKLEKELVKKGIAPDAIAQAGKDAAKLRALLEGSWQPVGVNPKVEGRRTMRLSRRSKYADSDGEDRDIDSDSVYDSPDATPEKIQPTLAITPVKPSARLKFPRPAPPLPSLDELREANISASGRTFTQEFDEETFDEDSFDIDLSHATVPWLPQKPTQEFSPALTSDNDSDSDDDNDSETTSEVCLPSPPLSDSFPSAENIHQIVLGSAWEVIESFRQYSEEGSDPMTMDEDWSTWVHLDVEMESLKVMCW